MLGFILALLLLYNPMNTHSLIIQDTHNVFLKGNSDYKVDLVISVDDYEMIQQNQPSTLDIVKEQFNVLSKLAIKDYNKALKTKRNEIFSNQEVNNSMRNTLYNEIHTINTRRLTKNALRKSDANADDETDYNYDNIINEYYDEAINEAKLNNTYHIRESNVSNRGIFKSLKGMVSVKLENCSEEDLKGIGFQSIKCLWHDYKNQRRSLQDIRIYIWRNVKIWFLVYLVIAVPLWCTRGWCCYCLCCKFFKPRRTIEEARKYVILNPPGLYKIRNREVHYDMTEQEIDTYEEFEHFIKTL